MIARLHALRTQGAVVSWVVAYPGMLVLVTAMRPDGTTLTGEGSSYEVAVDALVDALEGA